jgi:SAM-dependent methyltransferase
MHDDRIRDEFTKQSVTFGQAPVMRANETLGAFLELVPASAEARWLEVACGPGIIACALAERVGEVVGFDLTPAMVETARIDAAALDLSNVSFGVGDATALEIGDDAFDGAVTRFSLHHIPAPGRVLAELARVVRSGGAIVVGDIVSDDDATASARREEIERLRDPSHWACLSSQRMLDLGEAAGLVLEYQNTAALDLDFREWLGRGSAGRMNEALVESLLAEAPLDSESFRVTEREGSRHLGLRFLLAGWSVP